MADKGQQRGNREARKPKQAKATVTQPANPFAAVNKSAPNGGAGGKGKGKG